MSPASGAPYPKQQATGRSQAAERNSFAATGRKHRFSPRKGRSRTDSYATSWPVLPVQGEFEPRVAPRPPQPPNQPPAARPPQASQPPPAPPQQRVAGPEPPPPLPERHRHAAFDTVSSGTFPGGGLTFFDGIATALPRPQDIASSPRAFMGVGTRSRSNQSRLFSTP